MIARTMKRIPISIRSSGRPSVVVRVSLARIEGGGKVSFTDIRIHCLDPHNTARTLIHSKSGRLQVRGCDFSVPPDEALPKLQFLSLLLLIPDGLLAPEFWKG